MMWDGTNRVAGAGLGLLAVVVLVVAGAAADPAVPGVVESVGDGQQFEVRYTTTFSEDDFEFGQLRGYDTVQLDEGGYLSEPGWPMLPTQKVGLALPAGMAVSGVRLVATEPVELAGEYVIFPAQPRRPLSAAGEAEFVEPDPAAYGSAEAYPAEVVTFTHQTDLAGQAVAYVRLCPLQYVAAERRLVLHSVIEIVLEGVGGYECGDYLPPKISAQGRAMYERMVSGMVVNPEDVELRVGQTPAPLGRGVGPGDYDYVIITQSSWIDDFQPLADWKTKKGVPATIVDRAWIYSEYSGSSNQHDIRLFIQDARTNWGTMFFLLGGDSNILPYHTRSIYLPGEGAWLDVPNDTYYADYDTDWTCEVHVGRASVRDTSAIATFIGKVLTYETDPPLTDYAKTAAFFGFDLDHYGSGEGEGCKQAIEAVYLPADWTYRWEYDSEGGSHRSDVIGYLNQGNNLVNHADHSGSTSMGVGATNHNSYLYNSDMSNLYNGDRQSILYSLGCWACNYSATSTCIAEAFVRNAGGGGVAFVGNSRFGWYSPGSSDSSSLRYDRYFFRSLFPQGHYNLGACFSDHKNDAYEDDSYYQYIFTELTLLGDPELPIWTDGPDSLTVTHDATATVGLFTDFPVYVSSGGSPVDQATVCLWKEGDIYEVEPTDGSGTATFWFAPLSTGTMAVTVVKHNYVPYQGEADCTDGTGPYTLTVLVEGDGNVVVDPPDGPYDAGTEVELTADPDPDWCFDHWEGALTGGANPDSLVMNNNRIVTAVFAPDCNDNGTADADDILYCPPDDPNCADCNENGVPDECDIASGYSEDCQPNQVPDECDLMAPANVEAADDCADALIICPPTTYYGTTGGATNDGSASCGDSSSTPDVWYYYQPYGSGYLTISLAQSDYDTVVSVHSGCPGTEENELPDGCNDDYYGQQSRLDVLVMNGQSYWIRVSGHGGDTGTFEMLLTGPTCSYTAGDENQNGIPDECEGPCLEKGDSNCDGSINAFDIDPFVLALTGGQAAWEAAYTCDYLCANDCNDDGSVNAFDIDPFVAILTGP